MKDPFRDKKVDKGQELRAGIRKAFGLPETKETNTGYVSKRRQELLKRLDIQGTML